MKKKFVPVFEKREKYWIAWAKGLPGANTQGRTLAEARRNLAEAIKLIQEANREFKK